MGYKIASVYQPENDHQSQHIPNDRATAAGGWLVYAVRNSIHWMTSCFAQLVGALHSGHTTNG
jgi:hypothetical protein